MKIAGILGELKNKQIFYYWQFCRCFLEISNIETKRHEIYRVNFECVPWQQR